jgi:hypothetical protein
MRDTWNQRKQKAKASCREIKPQKKGGRVTVWSDEPTRTRAPRADDSHAGKVVITKNLNSVIVAVGNHQMHPFPVEANAAYTAKLPRQRSLPPEGEKVITSVVFQDLQSTVSAVEYNDVSPVAVQGNAYSTVERGMKHNARKGQGEAPVG